MLLTREKGAEDSKQFRESWTIAHRMARYLHVTAATAPEGQFERENKDMAKKTLKKSKKLESTKPLMKTR